VQNLPAADLWEARDVPLPPLGGFVTITNAQTTRDGFTVTFLGLAESNVKFPGGRSWGSNRRAFFKVSPSFSQKMSSWCLSIVDILDQNGHSINKTGVPGAVELNSMVDIPLDYSSYSVKARFVFGLTKPHTIEFKAKARNPE
jgi:hypothetical protein